MAPLLVLYAKKKKKSEIAKIKIASQITLITHCLKVGLFSFNETNLTPKMNDAKVYPCNRYKKASSKRGKMTIHETKHKIK